ncbi:hypothetical protein D9V37_15650 [Nocardioides mangrovicus]|uniref:2-C-methyl-D-erythritol 4-phosphate cytidylyltransferase n=1 Tax=Nocardioides mangrovicus TaxID=2478913 RepID=A0A3L8NY91_9ACTN|nr:2-C-methyl-D-erythritol 4-phosphate cytidylyltransferase [Nocardioides mangrovicus]RLV47597.1 hypothetical protein D9V37_15650 [Nocardioides mangrovicus]
MDEPTPLGIVPTTDRGSLPFALLHGEPLVVWASSALEDAGVDLVDFDVDWERLRDSGRPLVVHDPLCPATPAGFLAEAIRAAVAGEVVVAGVQPVADTLKRLEGDLIAGTADRDAFVRVVSPLVLPARVLAGAASPLDLADLPALVGRLRLEHRVELLAAPAAAARVADLASLRVLESGFEPFSR